jgi:hypothetical protein
MGPGDLGCVHPKAVFMRQSMSNELQAKLGKDLLKLFDDVMAEPNPFDVPPDLPPRGAPGQRASRRVGKDRAVAIAVGGCQKRLLGFANS